jgi:predicted ATP-grasp superfamily ATP-dependent carboligase
MKILIFEYVNGGGYADTELPLALAHEGFLMLKAVLNDFIASGDHELVVLLDERCIDLDLPKSITRISVGMHDNVLTVFTHAIQTCDAVLPVAPETEEILWTLCSAVEKAGKHLLSSSASAVAKTADKMKTFNILSHHHIPTVPSHLLDQYPHFYAEEGTVIKARDGAGCENCFVCNNEDDFERLLVSLHNPHNYVVQPFISGIALSISALFREGNGTVLCVNHQFISTHENQRLRLDGCEVNYQLEKAPFQMIVDQVAHAFPGLWGYVGIDLIKRDEQLLIVEINPRLTSSYVGIRDALGINVATQLLHLLDADVTLMPTKNHIVHIDLT